MTSVSPNQSFRSAEGLSSPRVRVAEGPSGDFQWRKRPMNDETRSRRAAEIKKAQEIIQSIHERNDAPLESHPTHPTHPTHTTHPMVKIIQERYEKNATPKPVVEVSPETAPSVSPSVPVYLEEIEREDAAIRAIREKYVGLHAALKDAEHAEITLLRMKFRDEEWGRNVGERIKQAIQQSQPTQNMVEVTADQERWVNTLVNHM